MQTALTKLSSVIILSFIISISFAQPGTLDSSFGVNGKVTTNLGYTYEQARISAIQQDGKIVTAGNTIPYNVENNFLVSRFLISGKPDSAFGINGKVITNFDTGALKGAMASSIIIQTDGKILVGGFDHGVSYFVIARYLSNGNLDSTFSGNGKVNFLLPFREAELLALALQKDGKILAGGNYDGYCLLRFLPTGDIDSSFGSNGKVLTNNFSFIRDIAVQDDGKIITAGRTDFSTAKIEIVRLLSDGLEDSSFGVNGHVLTSFIDEPDATSIALLKDNSIVMSGFTYEYSENIYRMILAKYKTNGNLDSSFGISGKVITTSISSSSSFAGKLLVQNNGKLIVTGNIILSNFTVSRFNSNGTVDSTFGVYGEAIANFGITSNSTSAVLQDDGKIVLIGTPHFSLARFKGDDPITISLKKNISVTEGNTGNTPALFQVVLNKPALTDVFVNCTTKDLNAVAGSDYIAVSGTVKIKAGKTKANIPVNVIGDNTKEKNEKFALIISNPVNAILGAVDSVVCTIKNDDPSFAFEAADAENISVKSGIKIYPNPVKDVLKIEGLNANDVSNISITDVQGHVVLKVKSSSLNYSLNIKQLPAGTYFVNVESNRQTQSLKFIKE